MEQGENAQGKPSPHLQSHMSGPSIEGADDRITVAQPEEGIFPVVCGHMDEGGKVHRMVHFRAPTGEEEDLWSNDSIPYSAKVTEMLVRCTKRFGDVANPGEIRQIVRNAPQGVRLDMLLALRTFSNYHEAGWIYKMEMKCQGRECSREDAPPFSVDVNLFEVGKYTPRFPNQDEYECFLPGAKVPIKWHRMRSIGDQIIEAVASNKNTRKFIATWSIVVRLMEYDGQDVSIGPDDVLDKNGRRLLDINGRGARRMSKRGAQAYKTARSLLTSDRDFLRSEFLENEPAIDLDVEAECPLCGYLNRGMLDMNQSSFLFPRATLTLSKRTFSNSWKDGI